MERSCHKALDQQGRDQSELDRRNAPLIVTKPADAAPVQTRVEPRKKGRFGHGSVSEWLVAEDGRGRNQVLAIGHGPGREVRVSDDKGGSLALSRLFLHAQGNVHRL